jgi:hypothetical protein
MEARDSSPETGPGAQRYVPCSEPPGRWPTLSLVRVSPFQDGPLLSSKTQPSANRAAGILRMAAMTLGRTETALGPFYRRLAYRVGKGQSDHRDCLQARDPRLAHAQGWFGLPRSGGRRVRCPPSSDGGFHGSVAWIVARLPSRPLSAAGADGPLDHPAWPARTLAPCPGADSPVHDCRSMCSPCRSWRSP